MFGSCCGEDRASCAIPSAHDEGGKGERRMKAKRVSLKGGSLQNKSRRRGEGPPGPCQLETASPSRHQQPFRM